MATNNCVNNVGGGPSVYFSAYVLAPITDCTGDGTLVYITYDTVSYNIGSAYNNTNGVFTAPSNGIYVFNTLTITSNFDSTDTFGAFNLVVNSGLPSMLAYSLWEGNPFGVSQINRGFLVPVNTTFTSTVQIKMVAGDTAQCTYMVDGSGKYVMISGTYDTNSTSFSGYKLI